MDATASRSGSRFARWRNIAWRTGFDLLEMDTSLRCAGVAFFAFLSLFPALASVVLIVGLVVNSGFLVDSVERLDQRIEVGQVTARDLRPVPPRHVRQLVRVPGQRAHPVAFVEQPLHQPRSDVTGRPGHQGMNLSHHQIPSRACQSFGTDA